MNDLTTLLNYLPYKLAAYDAKGNFLYDNGGADGSFFPREAENLPGWIMSEVLASPTKTISYPIPTDSFEQILIQTYQASTDQEGQVLGFWETIFDLKQPLQTYLDSSAQALVVWSDATSGASFKEEADK
ncbi:MAG: sodium transporter [Streptococcus sp.]|uniref:sodium transporter n=1 Tax=Streptococcus sp. TaxID=1306 RepID=UPI0025EE2E90|nr:sodium transporter [Streptococcus sp.]MBS6654442.1 sodium transporter [Streptococcus sp.]